MKKSFPVVWFCVFLLFLPLILSNCSNKPAVHVPRDCLPEFSDDMDFASLEAVIATNLAYLRGQDPEKKIFLGDRTSSLARLIESQEFFLKLLAERPSSDLLNQRIRENYDVFQATGTSGINLSRKMLVTGYYQPVFAGSLKKKHPFVHPLYTVPADLVQQKNHQGKTVTGRMQDGKLVPYWNREEIDNQHKATGAEIVWLKDPFDAFVLHIQGSGLIRLQDGTLRGIHFAAKNGQEYRSIGKYMVETGRMRLEDASMQTIREYLTNNPQERDEILHHNPSFIFFTWTDTHGAIGNLGKELTAGRSIAVDQKCFPPGALGFLFTRKRVISVGKNKTLQPLQRFVVVQDTGSAIRGPGRVDLFWGAGDEAGMKAGKMKEQGRLYFFILKEKKHHRST